jgi:hypothetical protein
MQTKKVYLYSGGKILDLRKYDIQPYSQAITPHRFQKNT